MCNVRESVKDRGATLYGVSVNHRTHICMGLHQILNIWYVFQYAKARPIVQLLSYQATSGGEVYISTCHLRLGNLSFMYGTKHLLLPLTMWSFGTSSLP